MTQRLVSTLHGDTIVANDGEIGSLDDAFFDDEDWTLRYLVIDTGRWLPGRRVLLSPRAVSQAGGDVLRVGLSRGEVENAPGIDADPPVSTLLSQAHNLEGPGYAVHGPYLWMPIAPAAVPPAAAGPAEREQAEQARRRAERSHLRASSAVVGCRIHASDGEIGHVEDFVVDDETWTITDMVVDTRNWLPGKKVLVPPSAIAGIDWEGNRAEVRLTRGELKQMPAQP